ncbi:MAG: hypothetical protein WA761_00635 [Thermoplasmata archaeon]
MGGIFQRPVCDLGPAYDFAFRPLIGVPDPDSGGGCDDAPERVELFAAGTDPSVPSAAWTYFSLCPAHRDQLKRYDERLETKGLPSRFRTPRSVPDRKPAGPSAR